MRFRCRVALFSAPLILAAAPAVDFNREIRPILSDKCFACHGPDAGNRKSALRLDTEAGAKADLGKSRFAVVPHDAARSELVRRINSENKALRMPPAYAGHDKLSPSEIDLLTRWIAEGAPWQKHWSLIAPVRATPPADVTGWAKSPIDHFLLARLKREGSQPSPEAPKSTLLRRLTLDLTGLPPTPSELDAFLRDHTPGAYEKVVDRLLASPHYAERMAIRWLDAARYADTNGYQSDGNRDMWRWRDWVIEAFNRNLPFDQFTVEQLAGDLLPEASLDQKIASGFQRNHRTNAEGGIVPEEFRVEYVADRAETTSTVWLGLTVGCARCHDHKYDPITQKDFYRLFAFFNNVPEKGLVYNFGNEEPYLRAPTKEQSQELAGLESKADAAEEAWKKLQPEIVKQQREWEESVRIKPVPDWSISAGRMVNLALKGEPPFDGKRVIIAGDQGQRDYLDPFTYAASINPTSPNGAILSRMEDYWEGEGYGLFIKDGKLRLHLTRRFTDIGLRIESEKPLSLNRWQHVAVTYDGYRKAKGVRMYVDGLPQPVKVLFDENEFPFGPKEPFRVGGGGGLRFTGSIRSVQVFDRALTAEEASALPVQQSIAALAAIPVARRTLGQAAKLTLCFLDTAAPEAVQQAQRQLSDAREQRRRFFDALPTVMMMAENPVPRDTFLLKRGAYDAPGEKVTPGAPSALPQLPNNAPGNRLGLAKWLVSRENPLTARVTVNRFWQHFFGTGLVKTTEDFGAQGERPVHPELLDWLAVEFMENGWDMKAIQKTIVMSAAYRQSSKVGESLIQKDPENRLLARGPRFRLPAEAIRDQALAVSGLLVPRIGGPSVKPYQPGGLWQELSGGRGYQPDKGEGLYRRSLYTFWKRTIAPPAMVTFDAPTRETCTVRVTRTNTPLQALNLMNDVAYVEASRRLAERVLTEIGGPSRLAYLYRVTLARDPKPAETKVLDEVLAKFRARFDAAPEAATALLKQGDFPMNPSLNAAELAAWTGLASLVLNLDETVTKE